MSIPPSSPSSGMHTHSGGDRNGMLSEDSRRQLIEAFNRAKSLQPPDDSPQSMQPKKQNPDSSRMQQPGFREDAGSQSKTLKPKPQLPAVLASVQDRRQLNLHNEQWRIGFGRLMVLASSAFNRRFGVIDLELWSMALAEYDLIDLNEGFSSFLKSPEGYPTPGKAEIHIKKCRQTRLGIVQR